MCLSVGYSRVAVRPHIFMSAKVCHRSSFLFDQVVKGHAVGHNVILFDIYEIVDGDIPAES